MFAVGYQYDPENGTAKMKHFAEKFEKKYGGFPSIISANAYDAVMLYAEALKGGARSSAEIKEYLRNKLGEYEGVSGTIAFDKYSENMPTHRMLQVRDGEFVEVHRFKPFSEEEMK